jgi:hypothetical protein
VESYLRQTRAIAVVALLALAGGVVSDALADGFWNRHALLAGLASSLIVVMLSVAVVNEALERRSRRRWAVLAQYVMFELVRNVRLIWTGVVELARLVPPDPPLRTLLDAGAQAVRDTPRLTAAVRDLVADGDRRRLLHREITHSARHSDALLGRWAGVMLNADAYAEVIDRHVELASDVAWLGTLLDHLEPAADPWQQRKTRSSVAVQMEGEKEGDWLVNRVVLITQLAEELDRATLQFAGRIVPPEWWAARLGTTYPAELWTFAVRQA